MPGFTTHHLFGEDVYHQIKYSLLKKIIHQNISAYTIGLQGPDIFFYYLPFLKENTGINGKNYGLRMHNENIRLFFQYSLEQLNNIMNQNPKKAMIDVSYLCGFFCHYILDVTCHPYIYARSGHDLSNPQYKRESSAKHRILETQIDTIYLKKKKKKLPSKFQKPKALSISKEKGYDLFDYIKNCVNSTYEGNLTAKQIKQVISYMKLECFLLTDPVGILTGLVELIENRTIKCAYISGLIVTDRPKKNNIKDPLNLSHHIWYSPWELEKIRQESFLDLYQTALSRMSLICSIFNQYLLDMIMDSPKAIIEQQHLLHELGNFSYHSGLFVKEN